MKFKNCINIIILVFCVSCCYGAKKKSAHDIQEKSFKPLLGHIAKPRKAIDLCGKWNYYLTDINAEMPPKTKFRKTLIVPSHQKSRFSGKYKKKCVWYRKKFELDVKPNQKVFACFERVCDTSTIFVNGKKAGSSNDGHFSFNIDITKYVKSGKNTMTVRVLGPSASEAYKNRPMGWAWYLSDFAGITFPVHLEITNSVYISDVYVVPKIKGGKSLETHVEIMNGSSSQRTLSLTGNVGEEFKYSPESITINPGEKKLVLLKQNWKNPKLWWPHSPHLYHLVLNLKENGNKIDSYRQRFGFREIRVNGIDILLNGKVMMHRRSSMITYYRRINREFMTNWFKLLRKRGYVGSRTHGGIQERVARYADEFGWLLSPESGINEPRGHQVTDVFWKNAEKHLLRMVKTLRNHPSIIYWCVSNEFGGVYMGKNSSKEEKKEVDKRLYEMGKKMMALDSQRTVTYSGDGSLGGGIGKSGPAPTLSFHYAWQPFKLENMIPNTVYWLEEKKKSWQRISWLKNKPVMLSEDLYPPYTIKFPLGASQWGGDAAYDNKKGKYKVWFDCYRMFVDGYYHSGVSTWNPWGVKEYDENNKLFEYGQLMPDFHIAVKELPLSFKSGAKEKRTVFAYNKLFKDLNCKFSAELVQNGKVINHIEKKFLLNGGGRKKFEFELSLPDVKDKQKLEWKLLLSSSGQVLAERIYDYSVYPVFYRIPVSPGTALLVGERFENISTLFNLPPAEKLNDALKRIPENLIIAGYKFSSGDLKLLNKSVQKGLKVIIFESPANCRLPLGIKTDKKHFAAFSFVRSPDNTIMNGLDNNDFSLWHPNAHVTKNTLIKPDSGNFDILTDCGSPKGMSLSPLLKKYYGKGWILFCQYPLLSLMQEEPAAKFILKKILNSFSVRDRQRTKLALLSEIDSATGKMLRSMDIPFSNSISNVAVVDGMTSILSKRRLDSIKRVLEHGGSVWVDGLSKENAKLLSRLAKSNIELDFDSISQIIKAKNNGIMSGLSNDDLYWNIKLDWREMKKKGKNWHRIKQKGKSVAYTLIKCETGSALTSPAALVEIPALKGKIVVSQLKLREFSGLRPVRVRRFVNTILHNLGARLGKGQSRDITPVDITKLVNRGFSSEHSKIKGWFGDKRDDMLYFPVNRTGIDPVLKVPQPVEPFPAGIQPYGDSQFVVINPEKNSGKSCLIIGGDCPNEVSIPISAVFKKIWLLGALNKIMKKGIAVAEIVFIYADNRNITKTLKSSVDISGYQKDAVLKTGKVAWSGLTPKYKNAVLWAVPVNNPRPGTEIEKVIIKALPYASIAVVAVSVEK